MASKPTSTRINRREAGAFLAALSALAVAGCGGGGDDGSAMGAGGGTMGGGTAGGTTATSYAAGPITGFGSVIVNGVRYEDSTAEVLDADEHRGSREQLRLGMMVEIDGAAMNHGMGTGRALRIRIGSAVVGPVESVGTASLVVLGQTVAVTDTTVFDDDIAGGLAGLVAGDIVEVHAQFDSASGAYQATRIELETGATAYRLRGVVAGLDTTTRTFNIGAAAISYAGVTDVPAALADGATVHALLQTVPAGGFWVATALRPGLRRLDDRPDAHLRGIVTAFTSTTDFEVNGLKVDATTATFPDGTAGIALGSRVEVVGAIAAGVLVATRIELDDRHLRDRHRFELHGAVADLDTTAKTFVLRGITVAYDASVTWRNGVEADLADGRLVEVRGQPSADRTRLDATEIEFE